MGKRIKHITFFLFCLLIPLICFSKEAMSDSHKDKIRVGYFDMEGYHITDENGRSGYGYEYLQEIGKYTGWEYEYIEGSWNECMEMLENGQLDLLTCVAYSEQRDSIFEYSKNSMGSCYAVMSTHEDEDRLYYCDFKGFNGIDVGLLVDSNVNVVFEDYCKENKFTVNKKYYLTDKDLKDALENREVDAIVNSSMRNAGREKIIARFGTYDFFTVSKKGNTELIGKLDEAFEKIKMLKPYYISDLYAKYYIDNYEEKITLTREEAEFLQDNKIIRAVAAPDREPLSYFENGEYKGIVRDIMNIVEEDLGIVFKYIETKSYGESLELVRDGKADVICDFYSDYNWAEKNNVNLTSPYLRLNYSAIKRKENAPTNLKVAITENLYFNKAYITRHHDKSNITVYNNEKECIEAVESGEQDITYVNTYVSENILSNGYYNNLTSNSVVGSSHRISLGVSHANSEILYKILDKESGSFNKEQIELIVENNTMFRDYDITWKTYIYHNPIEAILGISAVFILVILVLGILFSMRRKYMGKIYNLAYIDNITEVWNRNGFEEEAEKLIKENKNNKYMLISIDVNRFAVINDNYGRDEGDKILKFMSQILRDNIKDTGIISRLKADNFIMLIPYYDDINAMEFINNIIGKLKVYENNGQSIKLQLSCGAYSINDKNENIHTSIDMAEIARKEAKLKSEHIVFFNNNMEEKLCKEKEIEDNMEHALENREFKVYYQPKYDMRNNSIVGAEALVRWISTENGFMSPGDFIPLFEKNGFIIDLDFYVLEKVCEVIKSWIDNGKEIFPISVNQSRVHLTQKDYIGRLKDLKEKYNIPDNVIELELTETIFMDTKNISGFINDVKNMGFLISVDDFGSGYSSLNMLNKIPIDILKIDKDFLAETKTSERSKVIIQKVVQMAVELNMSVICEGVERSEQAKFLMEFGCNYAQGFLYSKPIPETEFLEKLL